MIEQYLTPEIVITVAITILVGALGLWGGSKIRPKKKPVVSYSDTTVQSSNHPKVKILYDEEEVSNLHAYNLVFWNHGEIEIRKDDIPSSNGPHFQVPDNGKILSVAYSASDKSSNARIEVEDNAAQAFFKFDFINAKEGLSAQILYSTPEVSTGNNTQPTIQGSLIGASKIISYKWPSESKAASLLSSALFFVLFIIAASMAFEEFALTKSGIAATLVLGIFALFPLAMFWAMFSTYLQARAPKWVVSQITQLKTGKKWLS